MVGELLGLACTQKSKNSEMYQQRVQAQGFQFPQHSMWFSSCSVYCVGSWAKNLLPTETYQNRDLLVSGAVSTSSRRSTNDSAGWEVKKEGVGEPSLQSRLRFHLTFLFLSWEWWTINPPLLVGQFSLFNAVCPQTTAPKFPGTRPMKIK